MDGQSEIDGPRAMGYFVVYRSDKDASLWSQDKLKTLLVGLIIKGKEGEGG